MGEGYEAGGSLDRCGIDLVTVPKMGQVGIQERILQAHRTVLGMARLYSLSPFPSLPCRGRLLHGRHFTYKSITGDMAITFVSTGVEGAFATEEHPYAAHGPWLQVRRLFPALSTLQRPFPRGSLVGCFGGAT